MLKFLKLIYGYVIILVRGENLERFLNTLQKQKKFITHDSRRNWTSCAGCTWNFMETAPCSQNYVTRCTASMKNEAAH